MKVLEVNGLSKTFRTRRRSVAAVRGLSLSVKEGEILAFLGPNGAGKTTTIKMIAGLIRPDSGSIRVMGKDPQKRSLALRDVGAVLEGNRNIYWRLAAEENMEYFGVLKGLSRREARRRAAVLVEHFGLGDKRGVTSQKLSRGMQQQVALAVALIHRPKLLLLDEPTLGLDVRAAERMKQVIREAATAGHAVLLTTHQLAVAEEIAHRVAIIDRGQIVVEEATPELLEQFSGESYRIELGTALNSARSERLAQLGASVDGSSLEYVGDAADLYRVFELLRPLPIVRVEKAGASLTEVFLHLTDNPPASREDGDV